MTDTEGSQHSFSMRVVDIEAATEFCLHAESEDRPTTGPWRQAD